MELGQDSLPVLLELLPLAPTPSLLTTSTWQKLRLSGSAYRAGSTGYTLIVIAPERNLGNLLQTGKPTMAA